MSRAARGGGRHCAHVTQDETQATQGATLTSSKHQVWGGITRKRLGVGLLAGKQTPFSYTFHHQDVGFVGLASCEPQASSIISCPERCRLSPPVSPKLPPPGNMRAMGHCAGGCTVQRVGPEGPCHLASVRTAWDTFPPPPPPSCIFCSWYPLLP